MGGIGECCYLCIAHQVNKDGDVHWQKIKDVGIEHLKSKFYFNLRHRILTVRVTEKERLTLY